MIKCHRKYLEQRCKERGRDLAASMNCIVAKEGDMLTVDVSHSSYPRADFGVLSFKCVPDCTTAQFPCEPGFCCEENLFDGTNSCQPCPSSSSSVALVTLWDCQNSNCVTKQGSLCQLNPLNGCPYEPYYCNNPGAETYWTGQNESGAQPAVLVCCSDIGFGWGFSQGFLNEQDWSSFWCSDYNGQTCGHMPVNDYNRCQYLMFLYGPTEAGDYCDRIELYLNNGYKVSDLNC